MKRSDLRDHFFLPITDEEWERIKPSDEELRETIRQAKLAAKEAAEMPRAMPTLGIRYR